MSTDRSTDTDVAIIGAGIVGAAVAWNVAQRMPGRTITVFEAESEPAQHQSGHNSGVIHSGLYYRPGSGRAELCRRGAGLMVEFARAHDIPFRIGGKLVVATDASEAARLDALTERADQNRVVVERLGPAGIAAVEPHAAGDRALLVPATGVTDYAAVTRALLAESGAACRFNTRATRVDAHDRGGATLMVSSGNAAPRAVRAGTVVVCAGLHADELAGRTAPVGIRTIAFRGEYFDVAEEQRSLVNSLIYPVPDPRWPFLGVHFTRGVDGSVHVGPNAVPASAREGYTRSVISKDYLSSALRWPGLWKLGAKYWPTAMAELWRSGSATRTAADAQRLVPSIRPEHLAPVPAGVRAQAVTRSGELLDDFEIVRQGAQIHVLNAPSPAATASLAIGEMIASLS